MPMPKALASRFALVFLCLIFGVALQAGYAAEISPTDTTTTAKVDTIAQTTAAKTTVTSGVKDSVQVALSDSTAPVDSTVKNDSSVQKVESPIPDSAASIEPAKISDSDKKKSKRQKIVRETTVNTLNELKGKYRSPKQALFMSLIVPGSGQAYVGGSAFNYIRAVSYFAIDVALGFGWYQYVHVKHDRKVKQYRAFADTTWSVTAYEDSLASRFPPEQNQAEVFYNANFLRENYCGYILNQYASRTTESLYRGCTDYVSDSNFTSQLGDFRRLYDDSKLSPSEISAQRAAFYSAFDFYEIIGKEQEFIVGWKDVENVVYKDTGVAANSDNRDIYVRMRRTAENYSQMQAQFLGGMVANHIVSAIDAALSARLHNRYLYETSTTWYDRIRLDSRLAFAGTDMHSWVGAYFTF